MLGSDHEGERANAARLATLELRRLGLTWSQLVERAFNAPAAARQERQNPYQQGLEPQRPWGQRTRAGDQGYGYQGERGGLKVWDIVTYADENADQLNAWERKFIASFLGVGKGARATENQWRILEQIAEKLGMERAA